MTLYYFINGSKFPRKNRWLVKGVRRRSDRVKGWLLGEQLFLSFKRAARKHGAQRRGNIRMAKPIARAI